MSEAPQPDPVELRERDRTTATELAWALREVQRAQADVDRQLARRLGLRPGDYRAVQHVMTAQEPLGPAELSARLAISTGSGTELVDRLEAAGHLERQRHPTDRRRVVLQPTAGAVERILGELGPVLASIDELAGTLTDDEQAAVLRYLRAAAQRMTTYAAGDAGPRD